MSHQYRLLPSKRVFRIGWTAILLAAAFAWPATAHAQTHPYDHVELSPEYQRIPHISRSPTRVASRTPSARNNFTQNDFTRDSYRRDAHARPAVNYYRPPTPVAPQNRIWAGRQRWITNSLRDVKASQRGDTLMILIEEQSDVRNQERRVLNKQGNSSVAGDASFGFEGVVGSASGGGSVDESSSSARQLNSTANFESRRGFTDQFSVQVVDVLPNGNLLVEGYRKVLIERDEKIIRVTGIVRSFDILPNNTISSTRVANFDMSYESTAGKGPESAFVNQGWFGRKMNRLWPF